MNVALQSVYKIYTLIIHSFSAKQGILLGCKISHIDPVCMFSSDRISKVGLYNGGGSGGRDIHHVGKTVVFKNEQKSFRRF